MSLSSACMRRSAKPARPGPPPGDGLCAGAADAAKARIAADPNAPNAIDSFMVFRPVGWKRAVTSKPTARAPGLLSPVGVSSPHLPRPTADTPLALGYLAWTCTGFRKSLL